MPPHDSAAHARPLKVAIVAHFAYGAMAGTTTGHIGGVEKQTSMLARWLASAATKCR
jgi:hypothetical protein